MDGKDFVQDMDKELWQLLSARDTALARLEQFADRALIPQLLRGSLRAELEAAEIAALWMVTTPEIGPKIAFAQQAGDEARHYHFISRRLQELGERPDDFAPAERSKLFRYFETLESTGERIAAAQFTREAIGYKANQLFITFCEQAGDGATAELYRSRIQPDEMRHHEWGKELLALFTAGEAAQERARQVILRTLELAEELRSVAAGKLLVETLPGC